MNDQIPDGFELARTTPTFDNNTVPAGLLAAHRVADEVWGRIIVHTGRVGFMFEDDPKPIAVLDAGNSMAIPPGRLHHVELDHPATFAVEFYRTTATPSAVQDGAESTGLDPQRTRDNHTKRTPT